LSKLLAWFAIQFCFVVQFKLNCSAKSIELRSKTNYFAAQSNLFRSSIQPEWQKKTAPRAARNGSSGGEIKKGGGAAAAYLKCGSGLSKVLQLPI